MVFCPMRLGYLQHRQAGLEGPAAVTKASDPGRVGPHPQEENRSSTALRRLAFLVSTILAAMLWFATPAMADRVGPWTAWNVARPQKVLNDLSQLPKWLRIRDWLRSGQDRKSQSLLGWIDWARSLRRLPQVQRVILIQSKVNQAFPYASDAVVWGVADYWETPAEVVAKGRTDCEGFAIFKLWLARIAGIDDSGMGIYIGVTPGAGEVHADLLVRVQGHDLVLDNRRASIVSASLMNFRPLMVLDLDDLHLFAKRLPAGVDVDPASLPTDSQAAR
jgi:predicted transglutaminase-like cysteine proteinase